MYFVIIPIFYSRIKLPTFIDCFPYHHLRQCRELASGGAIFRFIFLPTSPRDMMNSSSPIPMQKHSASRQTRPASSHPALLPVLGLLLCVSLITLSQQFHTRSGRSDEATRREAPPSRQPEPTSPRELPSAPSPKNEELAYLQARETLSRSDATSPKSTAYLLNQAYLLSTPQTLQPGQTVESFTYGRTTLSANDSIASPSNRFQIRTIYVDTSSARGEMPLGFFVTDRGYFTGLTYFLPLDGGLTTMNNLRWKDAHTISFDTTTHANGIPTVVAHTMKVPME